MSISSSYFFRSLNNWIMFSQVSCSSKMAIVGTILVIICMCIGSTASSDVKACPGVCTNNATLCTSHGGKIIGYCKNSKACCEIGSKMSSTKNIRQSQSCGGQFPSTDEVAWFKSPNYPDYSSGDLNCEFKIGLSDATTIGIKLHFVVFEMDGMKYGYNAKVCDSDMLFLKGFNGWTPPPRCGNLTGYATVIDLKDSRAADIKTLSLLALMSTSKYKWNIKVSLISLHSAQGVKKIHMEPRRFINAYDASSKSSSSDDEFNRKDDSMSFETSFITNGNNTAISQVPWQASLRLKNDYWTNRVGSDRMKAVFDASNCDYREHFHFCGGSIVHPKYILSAAHCIFGKSKTDKMKSISDMIVAIGDTNKCSTEDDQNSTTWYEIEEIIFHNAYDEVSCVENDVVLIKLAQEIQFLNDSNANARIIRLAPRDADYTEKTALASGWGKINISDANRSSPNILQSNNHFVIEDNATCANFMGILFNASPEKFTNHRKYTDLPSSTICTVGHFENSDSGTGNATKNAEPDALAGQGDSGGPLIVFNEDHEPIQIGIVSFGLTLGHGRAVIDYFQSVAYFRNWILLAMEQPVE